MEKYERMLDDVTDSLEQTNHELKVMVTVSGCVPCQLSMYPALLDTHVLVFVSLFKQMQYMEMQDQYSQFQRQIYL